MKTSRKLIISLATVATIGVATTAQAGAGVRWDAPHTVDVSDRDLCMITAQPWDMRTYALEADVDGTVAVLIPKADQNGDHFEARRWFFPAGLVTEVRWAWMGDSWGDVLPVNADCEFEVDYHATPGKQDSVVIERVPYGGPTVTTSTTTATPETTTTTAPFTEQTTVPVPPTVTVDVSTPATVPPSTIIPATTTSVPEIAAETPTPETTTSLPTVELEQLPVTGGRAATSGALAGVILTAGALAVGLERAILRRRNQG